MPATRGMVKGELHRRCSSIRNREYQSNSDFALKQRIFYISYVLLVQFLMKFLVIPKKARRAVGAGLLPLVSLLMIAGARGQAPASDPRGDVQRMAQQELQRYRSTFGSRSR